MTHGFVFAKVSLSGNFREFAENGSLYRVAWQIRDQNIGEKYLVCIQAYFHAKFVNSLLFARISFRSKK